MIFFFYLREKIIDFIRDYSLLQSESKYKVKYGRFLKMLTSKQMLQILPKVLAQVKTGNTYEKSLSEIREIIHSLHQAK